jgi:hypothetical protein
MTDNLPTAPAEPGRAMSVGEMFVSILELVKDPTISVEKASALLDMQERMIDRQAKADFFAAKAKVMLDLPRISRDGAIKNKDGKVQSRFATFEAIDKIVRPICASAGLVYSFIPAQSGNQITVTCELAHTGGHVERYGPMPLAIDASGAKNATQGAGSALSYGKRYTLCAALNIVTEGEDTDGGKGDARQVVPVTDEPWQEQILDAAQKAAAGGSASYAEWFKVQKNMHKGWLVDSGQHEICKRAAEEIDAA